MMLKIDCNQIFLLKSNFYQMFTKTKVILPKTFLSKPILLPVYIV